MTNRTVTFTPILRPLRETTMPRKPKSKPVYTFSLDSASDRFTFDYASNGLQVHAEGPFAKLIPKLRDLASAVPMVHHFTREGVLGQEAPAPAPAAAPKKPAKKKARRTVKTKKA
jgi:hypothetical protein